MSRNGEDIRIVILGKTGAGKSASGNTILGYEAFESRFRPNSQTKHCQKATGLVNSRRVSVIDTPGLFDTSTSNDEIIQEIKICICFSAPGPHVFLIVIKLGRFTQEEKRSVEMIQEMFGKMTNKYAVILFTGGDQLGDEPVEKFIEHVPAIQELVRNCDGRYHVFNNKTKDRSQVTELMKKITRMASRNGGSYYTNNMFKEAQNAMQERKQRILKEMEEKKCKEEAELKKKYEREAAEKVLQRLMHLTLEEDAAKNQGKAKKLKSVRLKFIDTISEPTLHKLLDHLLDKDIITDGEMDAVRGERLRSDKARQIIDTVRRKGDKPSSDMIDILHQLDRNLSDELRLLTGDGGVSGYISRYEMTHL